MSSRPRIAVAVSGGGRSLENLAHMSASAELGAEIALVVSNTAKAPALERARRLGLEHVVVDHRQFADTPSFSAAIFREVETRGAVLLVLAGFLRKLEVPPAWARRVINIHPALLPKFGGSGMFGERVHAAVLAAGERVSGCSVHYVTNEYDAGPIVLQRRTPVHAGDTPETLAARVFEEEKIALPAAIALHFGRAD